MSKSKRIPSGSRVHYPGCPDDRGTAWREGERLVILWDDGGVDEITRHGTLLTVNEGAKVEVVRFGNPTRRERERRERGQLLVPGEQVIYRNGGGYGVGVAVAPYGASWIIRTKQGEEIIRSDVQETGQETLFGIPLPTA